MFASINQSLRKKILLPLWVLNITALAGGIYLFPQIELQANDKPLINFFMWAVLMFVVLNVGGMLYLRFQILRPVNHIIDVITRRAKWNERLLCNVAETHEIGRMARALNQLFEVLDSSQEHLELVLKELEYGRTQTENQARELELQNQALEIARQQAAAASRAKSEFLANMSHEIRTPMTAILGYADLILEEGDIEKAPTKRLECINTIRRNGQQLLEIINDILDLSKIEACKLAVEPRACNPLQIVEDVKDLMSIRSQSKGLELQTDLQFPLPRSIVSDATRLRQILVNLVGNAIKFTETGSVVLRVRMITLPACQLVFEVIDSGMGMNDEQLAKLFKPFTQVDTSTTRKFGGSGLGLTISKRLATILGGDITVASSAGQGSTFALWLAITPDEARQTIQTLQEIYIKRPNELEAALPQNVMEPLLLDGRRILLAEDGLDNQRLVRHILTKAGASVEIADNGARACELALAAIERGAGFDLILMDMQMPILDGYQATQRLRAAGYRGKIVALTAHAMSGDRQSCLEAGCDDFATKPINRVVFLETIQKNLAACGSAQLAETHYSHFN